MLLLYLLGMKERTLTILKSSAGKESPAMRETWVQPLGWEDPLEKGTAFHFSIAVWRLPWTIYKVHGVAKSWTRLSDFHFHFHSLVDSPNTVA